MTGRLKRAARAAFLILLASATIGAENFEAQENFRAAMTAFKEKNFYSARLLLQEIVLKDPRGDLGDDAQYYLAMTYFYEGDYKTAQFEFKALERDFPESPMVVRAAFWNGEAWFYRKAYREAIESHTRFARKYRENILAASALYTIGYIYNEQKRYDEAQEVLSRALKEYPETTAAPALTLQLGIAQFNAAEYAPARRTFQNLMVKYATADNLGAARFWLGKSYYAEGKFPEAFGEFSAVTQEYPASTEAGEALYLAALCQYKIASVSAALPVLANVVQKYPQSQVYPFARLRQAQLYFETKDWGSALPPLLDLVNNHREHETFAPALDLLAEVRRKQGQPQEAIGLFEALRQEKDIKGKARKELLRRYADLLYQESRFTEAAAVYSELLNEFGQNAEGANFYLMLARAQYKDGKFEAALQSLSTLQKNYEDESSRAEALFLKAEISYALGKFNDALQGYARLVKKYPGHAKVFDAEMGLGWTYFELKQYARAADNFRKILRNYKKSQEQAKAYLALGAAQYNLRDLDGALASYRKIMNAFPQEQTEAAEARYQVAWLKFRRNEFSEADKEFRQYLSGKEVPREAEAKYFAALCKFQLGDYKSAEAELAAIYLDKAALPWIKEKSLADLAKARIALKDFVSARDAYLRLTEEFPESQGREEAYYQVVQLSLKAGDEKKAASAHQALKEKPGSVWYAESLSAFADYYRRKKNFSAADAMLTELVEMRKKPEEKLDALLAQAELYAMQNRDAEAMRLMEKILANEDLAESTALRAAASLFQLYEKSAKMADGEAYAEKLSSRFADNAKLSEEMLLAQARFAYLAKRFAASRDILGALTKSRNAGSRARFMLALTYQEEGDTARALDYFRQVSAEQDPPTWLKARFHIGEILFERGEYEGAAREFSRITYAQTRDEAIYEKSLYKAALAFRQIKKDKEFENFRAKLKEAFPQSVYLKELQ